jgi:hypothetical protein
VSNILAKTYDGLVALTPSDTTVFIKPYAGLYIAGAGTLTITDSRGTKSQLTIGVVGYILPVAVIQVWATGTAASGICGLVALPYMGGGA